MLININLLKLQSTVDVKIFDTILVGDNVRGASCCRQIAKKAPISLCFFQPNPGSPSELRAPRGDRADGTTGVALEDACPPASAVPWSATGLGRTTMGAVRAAAAAPNDGRALAGARWKDRGGAETGAGASRMFFIIRVGSAPGPDGGCPTPERFASRGTTRGCRMPGLQEGRASRRRGPAAAMAEVR